MSTGSEATIAGRDREVVDPDDAELRTRCYNRLTEADRLHWRRLANSAVPEDAKLAVSG